MLALGLILLLALALSGFFTAAELAVFSPGESRIRALVNEEMRGAAALAQVRARPNRLLVLLRLGDVLADVVAATAAASMAYLSWQLTGLAVATGVTVLVVVLVGELLPMRYAVRASTDLALRVAPVLVTLTGLLDPILAILERVTHVRPARTGEAAGAMTEGEMRELTARGQAVRDMEEHERQLVERAFRLDDTKAWDVMTPRVDIFSWKDSLTLAQIAPQLSSVPYSRIPLYGEAIDDTTGLLYVRDAYQSLLAGQRDVPLRELAREPLIVPASVPLTQLLREFQTRRIHLALVVDEYGGIDGLVTLEDVIEELVGEIVDETDLDEDTVVRLSRHEIVAAGDADLREINHVFNTSFPLLEHRSLNGYLLEELGHVPEAGERLERDGVRIEVIEATGTQVLRARLQRFPTSADAAASRSREKASSPAVQPPPADAVPPEASAGEAPAGATRPGTG